jgi:hypothetical protein
MPNVRVYDTGRCVRRVPTTGVQVVEYREEPGVYYTISGEVIDNEDWPVQAGFDVVAGRRERRRRELLREAERKIAEQVAAEDAAIEKTLTGEENARKPRPKAADDPEESAPQNEVHVQKGASLQAVHRGGGRYRVEDAGGNMIADGLSKKDADQFISDAAAAEEEEAAAAGG